MSRSIASSIRGTKETSIAPRDLKAKETDTQGSWFTGKPRHLALTDLPLRVTSWDIFLAYRGAKELIIAGQLIRYEKGKWAIIVKEKTALSAPIGRSPGRPKTQYEQTKLVLQLGGKLREVVVETPSKGSKTTQEKRPEGGPNNTLKISSGSEEGN